MSETGVTIRLPNGQKVQGVQLKQGIPALQQAVLQATFTPETTLYVAWADDLNGLRFIVQVRDESDQILMTHTQSLDEALTELAYADAPVEATLSAKELEGTGKYFLSRPGLIAMVSGLTWCATHQRNQVAVVATTPQALLFYAPKKEMSFTQRWAQGRLVALGDALTFRVIAKPDKTQQQHLDQVTAQL